MGRQDRSLSPALAGKYVVLFDDYENKMLSLSFHQLNVVPQVFDSPADHRYALTVWLTAIKPASIVQDEAEIALHFSKGPTLTSGAG